MLTWMTKMDDFCVFILTHGRPDKVFTLKTIQEKRYTGKTYLVVDDEDKTLPEYLKRFPEQVLVFSKAEIVKVLTRAIILVIDGQLFTLETLVLSWQSKLTASILFSLMMIIPTLDGHLHMNANMLLTNMLTI